MRFVLATGNAHKVGELRAILAPLMSGSDGPAPDGTAHELVGLGDVEGGDYPEPVEDGLDYAANALIKARAAATATGLPALADDSGIEVSALGGAPGIHSARYAGTRVDADNRAKLLAETAGVSDRTAAFVCAAALVMPDGGESVLTVRWPGTLLDAERGEGGFGYDPLFVPDDAAAGGRSAAELTAEEKNRMSHRALAFTALWRRVAPTLGA